MEMQVDYKVLVRIAMRRRRERLGSAFTQARLAEKLGIEASYLSRCLNHPTYHPSRELLFRILVAIEVRSERIQKCLRAYDLAQAGCPEYRKFLETFEFAPA